jgi:hypothetical protein
MISRGAHSEASGGEEQGGTPGASVGAQESSAPQRLFGGPRNLAATAAKYMYSFRDAEATDVSIKRPRLIHSASHVSACQLLCVLSGHDILQTAQCPYAPM